MTQPDSGSDGYVPHQYESEVYTKVAEANGNKTVWSPGYHDPADVAGKYSNKSAEFYERTLAAENGGYRAGLDPSDVLYQSIHMSGWSRSCMTARALRTWTNKG